MLYDPYVTSSVDRPESTYTEYRAQQSPSRTNDVPWCLICRTNCKSEDLPHKYIFDERLSLDELIESLLGLELDKNLPSAYLCHRCETELQRMSCQDDNSARGDMISQLESNLHQWPPRLALSAPVEEEEEEEEEEEGEEGGTVSATSKNTTTTSDPRHLFFTKDALSSSTFENLEESSASPYSVRMSSRGLMYRKEEGHAHSVGLEEVEIVEERNGDEIEEEEEGILDDTTTYILYSSPTGGLETRLLSHESSWSPSRIRRGEKSRSSSRHSSGDSEKQSRSESHSFSPDYTFEDQLSLPNRFNKTEFSSGQPSNNNNINKEVIVPERLTRDMTIPDSCGTGTSSVMTTTRLWTPSEKQEQDDTMVDEDEEDSRESEEDAITTTTTTTTTTTMTTPKGTTQWTKTRIKTIWDDAAEEEEMEEVAVEVATPSTSLPSSTEAAVAAASAATKKAFSHSPDTRRRRRENRHSSKERKAKTDQTGQWSENTDEGYRGSGFDMDTSTKTTQYYDSSRMDSGRPKSFQLAGDRLGNVCVYRGNYGDVGRDLTDREEPVPSEVDMKYISSDNVRNNQSFYKNSDFEYDQRENRTVSSGVDMEYIDSDNNRDRQYYHGDTDLSFDEREEMTVISEVDVNPDNGQSFDRNPVFSFDEGQERNGSNDDLVKYMKLEPHKEYVNSYPVFCDVDMPEIKDVRVEYFGDDSGIFTQGDGDQMEKKEEVEIVDYTEKKERRNSMEESRNTLYEVREERNFEKAKSEERTVYYPNQYEEKEEICKLEEKKVYFPVQYESKEIEKEEESSGYYPNQYEVKEKGDEERSGYYPEKEERNKKEETCEYYPYPSQHYDQDIDVCHPFPNPSPDQPTSNYRNDVEVKGGDRVDDGFKLNEDQKETIINSSVAGLGYQSTEFSSGYPPYSYPDNREEKVNEHRSTTSTTTTNTYNNEVVKGHIPKDEVGATTIGRKDRELTTYPEYPNENTPDSKDSDSNRLAVTSETNSKTGHEEENSNSEMNSGDQGSSSGSSKKYGGGQRGANEDPKGSGTSSPSHLRRQGSKDSRSSGRHRKRRHRGRNRDRSRDSEASNDSSSGSNPVVQPHDEVGGSAKEPGRAHNQKVGKQKATEEGDGAKSIAGCIEHKEEEGGVRPSEGQLSEKVEDTKGGATSGHSWTPTAAVGIETGEKGGRTLSPDTDHSPAIELPYKLDYRRSYYGEGENNNNNSNKDNKQDDEDSNNNNNTNNSNNEFFNNAGRETTRLAGIDNAFGTSTHDDILEESYPASYNQNQQQQQQVDSEYSNSTLFSKPNYGQSSNLENQILSPVENQQLSSEPQTFLDTQLSSPSTSNRQDYSTLGVYNTQPVTDYISPSKASYNFQQPNAPSANNSSSIMDNQGDASDTNAICTDNPAPDSSDLNADTTANNYDLNNGSSSIDQSNNMDSNPGDDFNGDANLTETTSDVQWSEPNKDTSAANAELDDSKPFRDDYESYHTEFAYGGDTSGGDMTGGDTSGGNADYNSGFNAEDDINMEPTEYSEDVTDFEEGPSAGAWAGYKEGGSGGDERMPSLNDEIAQADQNPNWNDSFDGGKDGEDDDGQKADWTTETTEIKFDLNQDDVNAEYDEKDNAYCVDNERHDDQLDDTGGFDDNCNDQNDQNDNSVEVELKDSNDMEEEDNEKEQSESRQNDSAEIDNYAPPQVDTENESPYDDNREAETGLVEDSQDYSGESGDYGGEGNLTATYNTEETCHDSTVETNNEEQHDEPGDDGIEPSEEISNFKIEEEKADQKDDDEEFNMKESPVELGSSYTQDIQTDKFGPNAQEDNDYAYKDSKADDDNMAGYDNQDGFGSHQGYEKGTEEFSWEMTQSAPETGAKRPMDLHLASTVFSEASPQTELGVDLEEDPPSQEADSNEFITEEEPPAEMSDVIQLSPTKEEAQSPCRSLDQTQYGGGEMGAESPSGRNNYWMSGGADEEGKNFGGFQEDSVTAINVATVHSAAVIEQTDTEAGMMAIEESIIPEVRSSIHTMYSGGRSTFDDSQYTSMHEFTNESGGTTWGSIGSNYETGMEVEGVTETKQVIEEALIVPTVREGSESYSYGYSSIMNNDMEDSEGPLRAAPGAADKSSDDLGSTTYPSGLSEYSSANNNLAATSVAGSFLDVPENTEQKKWTSFESSENKVPTTFGVAPHVERLRYGVMARSGRTATSAGRKRDDQKPLIGSEWRSLDGKEFDDRDGDSGFWTPETETDDNQDSDTMPFGFGKKKKNAALIEKEVSPPPQEFKEEPNAEPISVKADEPAFIAEDATTNDAGHVTVTEMVVEETMVEVVASEAVDGGTNEMIIETELVVGEKEEKGKTIEEMATETIVKDETAKETVAMTEEIIDQIISEDNGMELVKVSSNVLTDDLANTEELMSVDMDVLEDDDEVAILDRFEMLGQPAEPKPVETIVDKPTFDTPAPVVEKQPKKQPRVESTPLIRKQPTKVKDTQPGFLCCTII